MAEYPSPKKLLVRGSAGPGFPDVTGGASTTAVPQGPTLRSAFGLTEGPANAAGDAQARARILSAPQSGGYLDVLPSERDRNDLNEGPEGRDPANHVIPTRAESAREDAYVGQQIATTEAQDERRRQAIQAADELNARYRRQAAEEEFFARTGMPYDEKIAAKLREYDEQTAEETGLAEDLAAIEDDRDAELAQVAKVNPAGLSAAKEKWERQLANRLWIYGARRGVNVGNPITKTDPFSAAMSGASQPPA